MTIGNGGVIGPANIPTIYLARGVWSLAEQYLAQRQSIWPGIAPTTDPLFYYTSLLLSGQNTPGQTNNQFLDSGTANGGVGFPVTRSGNTTQGTFSPFSQTGWGNYFNGSADYLSVPDNAAFEIGAGNFTIEAYIYLTGYSPAYAGAGAGRTGMIICKDALSDRGYTFSVQGTASSWTTLDITLFPNNSSPVSTSASSTFALNTWYHVAVVRNGTSVRFYRNGVDVGGGTNSTTVQDTTATPVIGAQNPYWIGQGYGYYFPGYISNFRFVKGVAVYTGAFTVPSSPLTATQSAGTNISAITGTQTSLLTCQSNRFIDNSTANSGSGFTITRTGTPSIVAFSPFNPSSSWSAATYGGSGYFDGNGDYLSVASTSALGYGTGDFTIEFWYYPTSLAVDKQLWDQRVAGSDTLPDIYVSSTGALKYYTAGAERISGGTVTVNQWQHIALSKASGTTRLFINGGQVGSNYTDSNNYGTSSGLKLGTGWNVGDFVTGYIADARALKGTAVYTGNFTPPSLAPLTTAGSTSAASYPSTTNVNTSFASSATSLLLNFTNAGIFDASSRVLFETVNSASISNAITPKWGTTSMKFASSTSDYLWTNNQTAQVETFGTGDFTIDGWFYLSTVGTAFGIISRGTSTTGWSVNITSGQKLQFSYTTSNLTGATTINTGIWYYFAVVRSGSASGNLKLYLSTGGSISSADATSAGAVTDNFNQTNVIYVGADRVGTSLLNGYLQDIRMTNAARTITAAPTGAFPTKGA